MFGNTIITGVAAIQNVNVSAGSQAILPCRPNVMHIDMDYVKALDWYILVGCGLYLSDTAFSQLFHRYEV